jgi:uncharacterized membrane protein YccC
VDILLYTIIGTLIGTVIAMVFVSEGGGALTRLNRRIVHRVLSQLPDELPEPLRQRWSEEIEADLESFSKQPLRGLWFALRLRQQGARRLAAELVLQIALLAPAARTLNASRPPSNEPEAVDAVGWLINAYAREMRERLGYEGLEERHERGFRE